MHLIVDIRSRHPEDAVIIRYAQNWTKKWKKYNPHDTCTFLIFDQQEAPEWENFLRVKPVGWFSSSKKIASTNTNEIFRAINFSRYAPYDSSIPTLTFVMDMGRWLYDNETNANILRRKEREFEIKRLLKNSSHFIVPSFFAGNELVELWNIHEQKIDILPFVEIEKIPPNKQLFAQNNLPENFFLYDATFWSESNIEILLHEFGKFIHDLHGKTHLILHGNSAKSLKFLTEILRREKLEKWVHITGILDIHSQEMLYQKAKSWIFVGAYNTTKVNVELANSHDLLMILSDIRAFDFYPHAIKIHPNHLEKLSEIFSQIEKNHDFNLPEKNIFDEVVIFEQFKKILSKNPKISKS